MNKELRILRLKNRISKLEQKTAYDKSVRNIITKCERQLRKLEGNK